MSPNESAAERSTDTKKTPLLLDGVSHEDLTEGFLCEIHQAADDEGLPLENISVSTS